MTARERDGFLLSMPERCVERVAALVGLEGAGTRLKVSYRSTQMPFMESKPYEDNLSYCEAKLHKMGSIMPAWRATQTSVSPSRRSLAVVAGEP